MIIMAKLNGKKITLIGNSDPPSPRMVRMNYVNNMREYIASQNFVGKIQDCVGELQDINKVIKENNTWTADGIASDTFVDMESTKVRIVALTKAIDTNLKLLNKVLPDAREMKMKETVIEKDEESFAYALRKVENNVVKQRTN